jgi:peptidoglycan/xylan/chitin deacetylase (PgdA/CDA1 family)
MRLPSDTRPRTRLLFAGLLFACLLATSCTTILVSRQDLGLADRELVLSFDDGPGEVEAIDLALLDMLKEEGVRAWFCLIGAKVAGHEGVVARMHRDGHGIAFHSASHEPWFLMGPESLQGDLGDFDREVSAAIGEGFRALWLRPPLGVINLGLLDWLRKRGYSILYATHYPTDTFVDLAASRGDMERLEAKVRKDGGGIVVLHDGIELFPRPGPGDYSDPRSSADREWLVEGTRKFIISMKSAGYRFVDPPASTAREAASDRGSAAAGRRIPSDPIVRARNMRWSTGR